MQTRGQTAPRALTEPGGCVGLLWVNSTGTSQTFHRHPESVPCRLCTLCCAPCHSLALPPSSHAVAKAYGEQ